MTFSLREFWTCGVLWRESVLKVSRSMSESWHLAALCERLCCSYREKKSY